MTFRSCGTWLIAALVSYSVFGNFVQAENTAGNIAEKKPASVGSASSNSAASKSASSAGAAASAFNRGTFSIRKSLETRFGNDEERALLARIETFKRQAEESLIGQSRVIEPLCEKLSAYLRHFRQHRGKPYAAHLQGMSGSGKNELIDLLESLGVNIIHVDAQHAAFLPMDLLQRLDDNVWPTILFVNEFDKPVGASTNLEGAIEADSSLTPQVAELLNNGDLIDDDGSFMGNGSHLFVITATNLDSRILIDYHTAQGLSPKNRYEMTIDDWAKFDYWLTEGPTRRYEVLSRQFKDHIVGRMAPDLLFMKPLSADEYRRLILLEIEKAVASHREQEAFFNVEVEDSMVDFFMTYALVPGSGARETVARIKDLMGSLMLRGLQVVPKDLASVQTAAMMGRPRHLTFSYKAGEAPAIEVRVQTFKAAGKGFSPADSFAVALEYDPRSRVLRVPKENMSDVDVALKQSPPRVRTRPLKREIQAVRFSALGERVNGLSEALQNEFQGLGSLAERVAGEFLKYMSASAPADREPSALALMSFTGVGKTSIFKFCATYLKIPIVQLNLKDYADDDSETAARFTKNLLSQIQEAKEQGPEGKFLVILDELDKLSELDEDGHAVNRPIMGAINTLLSEGVLSSASTSRGDDQHARVDLRSAFIALTLNLGNVDFGFSADPRLTSIEDLQRALELISKNLSDRRDILARNFRDETVRRVLPLIEVVPVPSQKEFMMIVSRTATAEAASLMVSRSGDFKGQDISGVRIDFSEAYKNFLYSESIVPSEGPGGAITTAKRWVGRHVVLALSRLPREEPYMSKPVRLNFDYIPQGQEFVIHVTSEVPDTPAKAREIYRGRQEVNFPSLRAFGDVSEDRALTGLHEFGHAFASVRLGYRFKDMLSTSISNGAGGFVSFRGDTKKDEPLTTVRSEIARIYMLLASRVLERIFLSPAPKSKSAKHYITQGSSRDVQMATETLYELIDELGFDPYGGVGSRAALKPLIAGVSDETFQKMKLILQDLEDFMVRDFLAAHPRSWYQKLITRSTKEGHTTEEAFYQLIGYRFPGDNIYPLGDLNDLRTSFQLALVNDVPQSVKEARRFKQGKTATTPKQNLDRYVAFFDKTLKKQLHGGASKVCGAMVSGLSTKKEARKGAKKKR